MKTKFDLDAIEREVSDLSASAERRVDLFTLANELGVRRETVWRWRCLDPTFPAPERMAKGFRYSTDAVKAWLGRRVHSKSAQLKMQHSLQLAAPETRRRPP